MDVLETPLSISGSFRPPRPCSLRRGFEACGLMTSPAAPESRSQRSTGDGPLVDLAQIVVRTHALFISSPLASALPQLALELVNRPEAAHLYRERVISPLRDAAIDAVQRAIEQASWNGPDAETSVDMMIGTGLYRYNYLGHMSTLEEAFTIADTVAGRRLPRPDSSVERRH